MNKKILIAGGCLVALLAVGTVAFIAVDKSKQSDEVTEAIGAIEDDFSATPETETETETESELESETETRVPDTPSYTTVNEPTEYESLIEKVNEVSPYGDVTEYYAKDYGDGAVRLELSFSTGNYGIVDIDPEYAYLSIYDDDNEIVVTGDLNTGNIITVVVEEGSTEASTEPATETTTEVMEEE